MKYLFSIAAAKLLQLLKLAFIQKGKSMMIAMALFTLKSVLKNPKKAAELESQLLEIRDAINMLFPGK